MNGTNTIEHNKIINGLVITGVFLLLGIILFHEGVTNFYVWLITVSFFIISTVTLLYRSLDYVDKYDDVAIGIVGIIISGILLLLIVAILVMLVVAMIKVGKEGT